jgi:PilZ domain
MFFSPLPDQRRSPRQWIALPVQILMGKSRIEGTTLNLSDHGMYLFTAANIPLDTEIEIAFRPPAEKHSVQLRAIVRRKIIYLYGIEFLNCSDNTLTGEGLVRSRRSKGSWHIVGHDSF